MEHVEIILIIIISIYLDRDFIYHSYYIKPRHHLKKEKGGKLILIEIKWVKRKIKTAWYAQNERKKRTIEQKRDPLFILIKRDQIRLDPLSLILRIWLIPCGYLIYDKGWNIEQYETACLFSKSAGIMDSHLEENETQFSSPTIDKNQFQLLKAKQRF